MCIGPTQMRIPHIIILKSVCHKIILGKGVGQMLTKDDEGGGGVSQKVTKDEEGGPRNHQSWVK